MCILVAFQTRLERPGVDRTHTRVEYKYLLAAGVAARQNTFLDGICVIAMALDARAVML